MIRAFFPLFRDSAENETIVRLAGSAVHSTTILIAASALLAPVFSNAQVVTIDTHKSGPIAVQQGQESQVDRQYQQIKPTHVELPQGIMDTKTRLELMRIIQAEQGFAMRPFPRGHKGLTLVANGKLEPAGEGYLNMAINAGISAKPGDRVVVTDVKVDHGKVILQLNGGPDAKHRFLRHIEIGGDPNYTNPVVQDVKDPEGARVTIDFGKQVPPITPQQLKALLAPLISFDVKTPIQAFTDTLPVPLKDAILNHHVMVGMSTEMVMYAKGQPRTKSREMEGQMPFEEWVYGTPPEEVDFVRINGNRVIRVEIAKAGETPEIFTKDEVSGMMRGDGSPVVADNNVKVVREGDVIRDPNRQAPAAPPTLRKEGEQTPEQTDSKVPAGQRDRDKMRPVQMPKPHSQPGENPDSVPDAQPDSTASGSSQPK